MKIRITALIIAVFVVFTLSACSGGNDSYTPSRRDRDSPRNNDDTNAPVQDTPRDSTPPSSPTQPTPSVDDWPEIPMDAWEYAYCAEHGGIEIQWLDGWIQVYRYL